MKRNISYFQGVKNIELYILLFIILIFCVIIIYIYYNKYSLKEHFNFTDIRRYRLEFYYNNNLNDAKKIKKRDILLNVLDLLKQQKDITDYFITVHTYDSIENINEFKHFPQNTDNILIIVDTTNDSIIQNINLNTTSLNDNALSLLITNNSTYNNTIDNVKQLIYNSIKSFMDSNNRYIPLGNVNTQSFPTNWECVPGYSSPMRLDINKDVQCMSYNTRDCIWGGNCIYTKNIVDNIKPLTCGTDHNSKWGGTGYDNRYHWCYIARNYLNKKYNIK